MTSAKGTLGTAHTSMADRKLPCLFRLLLKIFAILLFGWIGAALVLILLLAAEFPLVDRFGFVGTVILPVSSILGPSAVYFTKYRIVMWEPYLWIYWTALALSLGLTIAGVVLKKKVLGMTIGVIGVIVWFLLGYFPFIGLHG